MENIVQFPGLGLEFTIRNSISIGPITFTFYGMIIALGLLLGLIYAFKNFKKVGVDSDKAIDCILGGIIGGIIGARLYYVAFTWSEFGLDFTTWGSFWDTFSRIFKTWEGGMAIYGGLIGALIVGVLIARWRKINVKALLDVIGIGFLIGQGVGRWGNFFNVEAFGSNTTLPWGMTGPSVVNYLSSKQAYLASVGVTVDPNLPVHPTFLYESLWCILGFALLAVYLKHRKFDGEVFLMYLGFYGAGRFVIEGLRTDSLMIGTLRVSQVLAAVLVFVSVLTIIIVRSKIKGNHDENYLKLFVTTEEGMKIAQGIKEEPVQKVKKSKIGIISEEDADKIVEETDEIAEGIDQETKELDKAIIKIDEAIDETDIKKDSDNNG